MHPVLFEIGGFSIHSYGVMISIAVLVAAVLMFREAPRLGLNPDYVLEAVIVTSVSGLVGSRLLYVALNWEYYSGHLLSILFARFEGLSFYGAFIGGAIALYAWGRWRQVSFPKLSDLAAPYLALGYSFGRIGCLLNGCCFGKLSEVSWALPASMVDTLPRHPVQLYAAAGALLIFIVLKLLEPVRPFSGFNLFALAALYGILRFTTEFFRDEAQIWFGMTAAQLFSLSLTITALLIIAAVMAGDKKKRITR